MNEFDSYTQDKAQANIDILQSIRDRYAAFYSPADKATIVEYLKLVKAMHREGMFGPDWVEDLRSMPWVRHNIRHGQYSILGTCSEALALGIMNMQNNYTQYRFNGGKKEEEVSGADLWVFRQRWPRDYSVQVKTVRNLSGISLDPRWRNYKKVDRLILADPFGRQVVEVDYPEYQTFAKGRSFVSLNIIMSHKELKPCLYK